MGQKRRTKNVFLNQKSFLSQKFNPFMMLAMEPARLLRAWQRHYRHTGDYTTGAWGVAANV